MALAPIPLTGPLPDAPGPNYQPRVGSNTFRGVHRTKTTEDELVALELAEAQARFEDAERQSISQAAKAEQDRFRAWREAR